MPALLLCELILEDRHGFLAFANFVKELAVSSAAHALYVGEIRRRRVVTAGVSAIAFSGVAVAVRALVGINFSRGFQRLNCRLQGIFQLPGFLGNRPRPGSFIYSGIDDGASNDGENQQEHCFRQRALPFRWSLHSGQRIFAHEGNAGKNGRARMATALTAEDEPEKLAIEEKDGHRDHPGYDLRYSRVDQRAHFSAVAGKLNQRNNGKR